MSEFQPITTQEQFDNMISDRLERERTKLTSQYADYDELKNKVTDLTAKLKDAEQEKNPLNAKINELEGKVQKYESDSVKTRIANELGIPNYLAERLAGATEEEIRKDAQQISTFLKSKAPDPIASLEPDGKESKIDTACRELLSKL